MNQDAELALTCQVAPNNNHKRGTETYLNPEGGSLQEAPVRGRGNLNTSTTSKYNRRTHLSIGNCSGSADNMDGTSRRTIGRDSITLEGMAKGGYQGALCLTMELGKCDDVVYV